MSGRNVCISVDSSAVSQEAMNWAADHVLKKGDKVFLCTVIEPSIKSELESGVDRMRGLTPGRIHCEADPETLKKTESFLAGCREELAKKGLPAADISTAPLVACIGNSHDIGRHILDYSEANKCDSLVMGSRGLGAGRRAVLGLLGLGSVSEFVVKHAGCNVIVHKSAPEPAK